MSLEGAAADVILVIFERIAQIFLNHVPEQDLHACLSDAAVTRQKALKELADQQKFGG